MKHAVFEELQRDLTFVTGSEFTRRAAAHLHSPEAPQRRVFPGASAEAMASSFDEPLPAAGVPMEQLLTQMDAQVLAQSNYFSDPRYMGHQLGYPLPAGVWTDMLISAMNQSMAVRELSPALTAIERQTLRWLTDRIGWGPEAGGVVTSGGTEATFTGLLAARAAALPDAWEEGVGASQHVVLCGEHTHYSVARAVAEMGFGARRVVKVPSRDFRMDVDALRQQIVQLSEQGVPVLAVVATAGTTATGSFDDLDAVGAVCEAHRIWFHVDACHGGSALFSSTHREKLRGLQRAQSVAWDPHKVMMLPLANGLILVRDESALANAFQQHAPYLFGDTPGQRNWDQGKRSFQGARRGDVLKLWVALKRYGAEGFGALYDHGCNMTRYLYERLQKRAEFETIHEPECNILCFRYGGNVEESRRDAFQISLREALHATGNAWITTTVFEGQQVLRTTILHPQTDEGHVDHLCDELIAQANQLM